MNDDWNSSVINSSVINSSVINSSVIKSPLTKIICNIAGASLLCCFSAQVFAQSKPTFNIWEYEVRGVKTLPSDAIEAAVSPYLGPDKVFSDVEEAARAIERAYRDAGYPVIVAEVPEQDVLGGKVKINVTEGTIATVKVTDSDYFLLSKIKDRISSVKPDQPLYVPKLQEELNKLNSLSSDLRVVPIIKQGDQQGSVNVELKVKDKLPLHGEIEYNNYASANTTATRASASIGYDNLWNKFHSFSLNYQTTPEDTSEIKVLAGTYVLPMEDSASRLAIYGVNSKSQIYAITEFNGIKILGNTDVLGFRYVKPTNYSGGFQQVVTFGADYKDVAEITTIARDVSASQKEFRDSNKNYFNDLDPKDRLVSPITYAVFSGEYKVTWRAENSMTQLGGGVYFGIRDFFNSQEEFETRRFLAAPNFIYWKGNFQETLKLPADFEWISKIKLQSSSAPLISNEQLGIGGQNTVRGYFESQSMGDRGAIASMELATPSLLKEHKALSNLKFYIFVDAGVAEIINPLPDQKTSFKLASSGFGIEFSSYKQLSAELNWAMPLRDSCGGICGKSASDVEKNDSKATFNLTYKY